MVREFYRVTIDVPTFDKIPEALVEVGEHVRWHIEQGLIPWALGSGKLSKVEWFIEQRTTWQDNDD